MATSDFGGRTILVTGGASGIGGAIADRFADRGAIVWRLDRALPDGDRALRLDVTDPAAIEAAVARIVDATGAIDVLVNSAGVYGLQPWGRIDPEDYRRIFDVNVLGLTLMTQAVAPHMPRGAAIINIASSAARRGNPTSVLYAASKSAVISLTQSAALAFASRGIRVNAIAPGRVETPMWDEVLGHRAAAEAVPVDRLRETMASGIPLERMAAPEDIVGPALFLAGPDSDYMTGQTVNVDGGLQFN